MTDVVNLLIVVAFFAAATAYVHLCARITTIDHVEGTPGGAAGEDSGSSSEVRS